MLVAIDACLFIMFVKEEQCIPEIASPKKEWLGKSIFQAQTLIGLKLWMSSLFIVADLFFVYFTHL